MLSVSGSIYCSSKKERIPILSIGNVWEELVSDFVVNTDTNYQNIVIDQDMYTKDEDSHTKILFVEKRKKLNNWRMLILDDVIDSIAILITDDTIVKVNSKGFTKVSDVQVDDTLPVWSLKSFTNFRVTRNNPVADIATGYNIITESKEFIGSGLIIKNV